MATCIYTTLLLNPGEKPTTRLDDDIPVIQLISPYGVNDYKVQFQSLNRGDADDTVRYLEELAEQALELAAAVKQRQS